MKRYKACSKCGRVHDINIDCTPRIYAPRMDEAYQTRNTNAWHKLSLRIREDAHWLCEYCKQNGEYNHEGLEVHHITPIKEDPAEAFNPFNLVTLCGSCHEKAERGEISKETLRKLAEERERTSPGV